MKYCLILPDIQQIILWLSKYFFYSCWVLFFTDHTEHRYFTKQICSKKDASESRDEVKIAERLARLNCGLFVADRLQAYCRLFTGYLQVIYCRLSAGVLQVVYRLFSVRRPHLDLSSHFKLFPLNFRGLKKNRLNRPTDRRTEGPTDGWMDRTSYRDAWSHLKTS